MYNQIMCISRYFEISFFAAEEMMKSWRDLKVAIEHEGDVSEDAKVFITKRRRKLLSCWLKLRSHLQPRHPFQW